MKTMKLVLPALLMVVPIHFARAADSGTFTVGPNLGIGVVTESANAGSSVTAIGLPSGGGILFGSLQPGLRLGFVVPSRRFDVYLDVALNYSSSDGSSFHTFLGGLNLQYNFMPEAATTVYATGGGGLSNIGGDFLAGETDPTLGAALGLRHMVSDEHGALRAELRYDRLIADSFRTDLNSFALKLGVDLWIP